MNRRNVLQLILAGISGAATSNLFAKTKESKVTDNKTISKTPDILDVTGLTVKEYQAVTTIILGHHPDTHEMTWELALIPSPERSNYTYHVGDVKYNGNYYFVNYYVEDKEQPYGITKRVILTSIGKSRTRFYDKAEGNRFVESGSELS